MILGELINAVSGKVFGLLDESVNYNDIKINSKLVLNGDVFVAIRGRKFDGHDFIDEAIENGAVFIITEIELNTGIPYILVSDSVKAIGDITHYMIKKYNPLVIGVTGSVGKSTTKNLLYTVLKSKYNVLTNEKNFNNNIGVPLTVFNLNENIDVLLLELGMNHLGEISYLSNMVNPDIGVITNIGSSHIGYLGSKEKILETKLEILDGMDKKVLFVNGDDVLLKKVDSFKSGFNSYNDLVGYDVNSNLFNSSFKIKSNGKEYDVFVNVQNHLLSDVLLSINVALYMGVSIEDILSSLKKYRSLDMRMNVFRDLNNNIVIDDCYNSSFESLIGVLSVLEKEDMEKLLILGDINELGEYGALIHKSLSTYINRINNKEVYLVGPLMKNVNSFSLHFDSYNDLLDYLNKKTIKNKIVLIKGSRCMKLENIVKHFKKL